MIGRMGVTLFSMLVVLISTPASAQDRPVCFEPGTPSLTSDGYVAVRDAVEHFRPQTQPGERRSPSSLAVIIPERATPLEQSRADEVLLELLMAGAPSIRVRIKAEGERGDGECLPIRVVPDCCVIRDGEVVFFDSGSDTVPPYSRRNGRFLLVDYQPGETLFLIDGYTDTAEASVELSRRRAENVALDLVWLGVRWDDIRIRARGDAQLARPTPPATAEPLNRRVTVDVRRRPRESFD